MESRNYWEENGHAVKYENFNSNDEGFGRSVGCSDQLNFAAAPSEDEADYPPGHYLKKGKVPRQDPMSHRIIEKRRRDRMNNCLADLSRLIPPEYMKKGRGRVEKTEIIEMAIRHLKYLQERANGLYTANKEANDVADRAEDATGHYRAGYNEASAEAVRFLVEVQGYGPADGLCLQLASHLQRQCSLRPKGEPPRDTHNNHGSSSETNSSSSSSNGYVMNGLNGSVIARTVPRFPEAYEPPEQVYSMDCDRVSMNGVKLTAEEECFNDEPLPLDGQRKDVNLRTVRKPEHTDDYLHSYKFKNSIERRFSRSQDTEARDMSVRAPDAPQGQIKVLHKRRRPHKPAPTMSTSTSNSGSTEDTRDTSPQDTSSDDPHHQHYEKPAAQLVPVFALNAVGKYYVPVNIDYACLSRHQGAFDVLDARPAHVTSPLHSVSINVNFQPCTNYHVKRENGNRRDWRGD